VIYSPRCALATNFTLRVALRVVKILTKHWQPIIIELSITNLIFWVCSKFSSSSLPQMLFRCVPWEWTRHLLVIFRRRINYLEKAAKRLYFTFPKSTKCEKRQNMFHFSERVAKRKNKFSSFFVHFCRFYIFLVVDWFVYLKKRESFSSIFYGNTINN